MTTRLPSWAITTAYGALIVAVSMGIRQTFGVFLLPISAALEIGREQVGLTIAVQNLAFGIGLPFIGALADRRGARAIVAVGALLYAAGLWAVTTATSGWTLLLSLGLIVGLAQSATTFVVVFGALGRVVPAQHRGLAFGLATAGGSLGMFVFVPIAQMLVSAMGWQAALTSLAGVALLMLAVAPGLGGGPRPRNVTPTPTAPTGAVLTAASRHSGYLLLNLGFFVCGFHVAFIATHFPAYLADYAVAPAVAAGALALIGLGNIAGSYLFGALGDRLVKKRVLSAIYLGRALTFTLFLLLPLSEITALAFGAVIGLLWLGTVPLTSGVVAQLFGARHLGMLYGIVFLSHQLGAFLGAWLGGAVYDRSGSYIPVWAAALGLSLIAAAIHWLLDDQPVRRLQEQPA